MTPSTTSYRMPQRRLVPVGYLSGFADYILLPASVRIVAAMSPLNFAIARL
jgi:hypothetical protein